MDVASTGGFTTGRNVLVMPGQHMGLLLCSSVQCSTCSIPFSLSMFGSTKLLLVLDSALLMAQITRSGGNRVKQDKLGKSYEPLTW